MGLPQVRSERVFADNFPYGRTKHRLKIIGEPERPVEGIMRQILTLSGYRFAKMPGTVTECSSQYISCPRLLKLRYESSHFRMKREPGSANITAFATRSGLPKHCRPVADRVKAAVNEYVRVQINTAMLQQYFQPCNIGSVSGFLRAGVVIPAFNAAPWIATAIKSILAQVGVEWRLVVVDDGSEDATPLVVNSISDSRIRLVRQPNSGWPASDSSG